MKRRPRGRHHRRRLGAAALPALDLIVAIRGECKVVDAGHVIDRRPAEVPHDR